MNKIAYIFSIILVSISLIAIGQGLNLVICSHSHTISFADSEISCCKKDGSTAVHSTSDCMHHLKVFVSDSEQTPSIAYNFVAVNKDNRVHVFRKECFSERLGVTKKKIDIEILPRDYLRDLSVLII